MSAARSISTEKRRAVIEAHDGVCFYCATADATHVDHIVPRVCGGTNDLGNLIASCLPCNLRKHRHRLPPEAEQRALAAAQNVIYRMIEIKYGMPRGSYLAAGKTPKQIPKRPRRKEKMDQRVPVTMTAAMMAQIDAWAQRQGIIGRSEAIRLMIEEKLQAEQVDAVAAA